MTELLNTPETPTSMLSRIKEFRDHPDRFLWGAAVLIPLTCVLLPFLELGIGAWTNLLTLVVLSAIVAWQDIQRLKETQRQVPDTWTLAVIPVYLWQRLTRNGQPLLPLFGWVVTTFAVITLSFYADNQALADQSCELVSQIIHEQLNGAADCVAVKIDEKIKDGFYKATATLDNGNDISITVDDTSGDNIYVRIAN